MELLIRRIKVIIVHGRREWRKMKRRGERNDGMMRLGVAASAFACTLVVTELVFVSALTMVVFAGFATPALAVIARTSDRRRRLGNGSRTQSFEVQQFGDEGRFLHYPVVVCARDE